MNDAPCTCPGGRDPAEEHVSTCMARLKPHGTPLTKTEALYMAQRWGTTWSHHNDILAYAAEDGKQTHQQALAMIAVADAAEVARLSALHSMLPDIHPDSPF